MPKLYEALAEAVLVEGVDTQFVLMGDGGTNTRPGAATCDRHGTFLA